MERARIDARRGDLRHWRRGDPVGAGWEGADDPFQADMDLADHQTALIEYENGVRLSFHSNSHAAITERRWNLIGTEGALTADLAKNTMSFRRRMGIRRMGVTPTAPAYSVATLRSRSVWADAKSSCSSRSRARSIVSPSRAGVTGLRR